MSLKLKMTRKRAPCLRTVLRHTSAGDTRVSQSELSPAKRKALQPCYFDSSIREGFRGSEGMFISIHPFQGPFEQTWTNLGVCPRTAPFLCLLCFYPPTSKVWVKAVCRLLIFFYHPHSRQILHSETTPSPSAALCGSPLCRLKLGYAALLKACSWGPGSQESRL